MWLRSNRRMVSCVYVNIYKLSIASVNWIMWINILSIKQRNVHASVSWREGFLCLSVCTREVNTLEFFEFRGKCPTGTPTWRNEVSLSTGINLPRIVFDIWMQHCVCNIQRTEWKHICSYNNGRGLWYINLEILLVNSHLECSQTIVMRKLCVCVYYTIQQQARNFTSFGRCSKLEATSILKGLTKMDFFLCKSSFPELDQSHPIMYFCPKSKLRISGFIKCLYLIKSSVPFLFPWKKERLYISCRS